MRGRLGPQVVKWQMSFEQVLNTFWTSTRRGAALDDGDGDFEWTQSLERFCSRHRDVGAGALSELVDVSAREVIDHMGSLGVDVPPVPLLGDVCPWCGRRMSSSGRARESGLCDSCHRRLMTSLRADARAELDAARVDSRMRLDDYGVRHG